MRSLLADKRGMAPDSGPNMILSWIIAFGLIGLIASVFLLINTEFKNETVNGSLEEQAIEDASQGIAKITSKLPLIGTIVVLSVILIIVLAVVAYVRLQAGAYGNVQ